MLTGCWFDASTVKGKQLRLRNIVDGSWPSCADWTLRFVGIDVVRSSQEAVHGRLPRARVFVTKVVAVHIGPIVAGNGDFRTAPVKHAPRMFRLGALWITDLSYRLSRTIYSGARWEITPLRAVGVLWLP